MKKIVVMLLVMLPAFAGTAYAQKQKMKDVPGAVREALKKKYPDATNITWEKEKGNYEANWGGKSGEDNSVQFKPTGEFIEIANALPVSQLPKNAVDYIKAHYRKAKITEAGKITSANGSVTYEAEVNRKDIVFDQEGKFIKVED